MAAAIVADSSVATGAVDIQFSLCDTPERIEQALELRPHGGATEVWLFDTPMLALYAKGLRLRLRGSGANEDLTLKATDQDCSRLPEGTLSPGSGKCEFDLHGTVKTGSLSLTLPIDKQTVGELKAGRLPVVQALGAAQREFLQSQPGAWPLANDIRPLGPTQVRSYRARKLKYDVDVSTLPGGSPVYRDLAQGIVGRRCATERQVQGRPRSGRSRRLCRSDRPSRQQAAATARAALTAGLWASGFRVIGQGNSRQASCCHARRYRTDNGPKAGTR